jgi:hypothetical protein
MTRNISDILTEILNEGPMQQLEGNGFVGRVNVRLGGIFVFVSFKPENKECQNQTYCEKLQKYKKAG